MSRFIHKTQLLTASILSLLFACQMGGAGGRNVAPDHNYYVEISTLQNDNYNNALVTYLIDKIPNHKYTITNQSGLHWPYYKELELNEEILLDSLMPPHEFVHKMQMRETGTGLQNGDHVVRIELMPKQDTIPNYRVNIYTMDSTALVFSASSEIHFVDTTRFPSFRELSEYYLKSIVRYSFK